MIEHELNARPLEYSEVGGKFVIHPAFQELVSLNNSIVIGPRGSGKTTMLRMLTPEALKFWAPKSEEERKLKESISFLGLYVPMSRIFQDDLEKRFENSILPIEKKRSIVNKIYYLNIVDSVLELIFFLVRDKNLSASDEIEAVSLLKRVLKINDPYCYKISSVIRNLAEIKLEARRSLSLNEIEIESDNYSVGIISSIDPLLKVVNEIFGLKPSQKYAICLDELDVYASVFTAEMIRNLRGMSTNIILKLTLAPLHTVEISDFMDPPQSIHDYDKIYLWPNPESSKNGDEDKKYLNFAERLASQTLFEIMNLEVNLNELLGEFSYREVFKELKKSETENNVFRDINFEELSDSDLDICLFLKMAHIDKSFKTFLETDKGINIGEISNIGRKKSSSVLRKIKPIVFNRLITSKLIKGKWQFKNQKVPIQYHGKNMMLKMLDGNPRYLKKLMEYLSKEVKIANGKVSKLSIYSQSRALVKVKDLFLQRIDSIPLLDIEKSQSTGSLIREIGNYLSQEMNFRENWHSTSFPSYIKIPNIREIRLYESTFRKAINNGALLIIGENELDKLNTVKYKELRLNYLLHIEFKLPIRKYYPASFQDVIKVPPTKTLFENV